MTITEKAQRLLRYHRQNVFADCEATASRHQRAARRIKASRTFRAYMASNAEAAAYRASESALRRGA